MQVVRGHGENSMNRQDEDKFFAEIMSWAKPAQVAHDAAAALIAGIQRSSGPVYVNPRHPSYVTTAFGMRPVQTVYDELEHYETDGGLIDVYCLYCYAWPGEKCRTKSGRVAREFHSERYWNTRTERGRPLIITEQP